MIRQPFEQEHNFHARIRAKGFDGFIARPKLSADGPWEYVGRCADGKVKFRWHGLVYFDADQGNGWAAPTSIVLEVSEGAPIEDFRPEFEHQFAIAEAMAVVSFREQCDEGKFHGAVDDGLPRLRIVSSGDNMKIWVGDPGAGASSVVDGPKLLAYLDELLVRMEQAGRSMGWAMGASEEGGVVAWEVDHAQG